METLSMHPKTGERLVRYVGDWLRFRIERPGGLPDEGFEARLRTTLGRADVLREEVRERTVGNDSLSLFSWRDIPMRPDEGGWTLDLPLVEVGYFKAKAFLLDSRHRQYWPDGPDVGVSVHPNFTRTANTIYCAWIRLFGETKHSEALNSAENEKAFEPLDEQGFSVIPPSGKIRDLVKELPHIIDRLGCRIIHLLPVNPTPTTYARFGRYGSPYAVQDLEGIDPALVEFDKRTTGGDQFRELTYAVHERGAKVFIDVVVNHTGWGSVMHENRSDWYQRDDEGKFASPGAWGTVWEDLVELDHEKPALWDYLAEVFLTWCERGVDGFRCDAGYMVPTPAWQYIISRVRSEYPETVFLLEGLGGAWSATEELLTEGGMQWAYSELFQEYNGAQVAGYLDHALKQSQRAGTLVHYSETHDNNRLAAKGKTWSLLRNQLSGLTSVTGGYGFTCGVEWLAAEKIIVHQRSGLSWGKSDNIVEELGRLNRLLADHPCFFDGAKLKRLSPSGTSVFALRRRSADDADEVLALVNTDDASPQEIEISLDAFHESAAPTVDLLGQSDVGSDLSVAGAVRYSLPAGACSCLAHDGDVTGLRGDAYRTARNQAAWALSLLSQAAPIEVIPQWPWDELAGVIDANLKGFLAAISVPDWWTRFQEQDGVESLKSFLEEGHFQNVVEWVPDDRPRILIVPREHWLLISDSARFRVEFVFERGDVRYRAESILAGGSHVAAFRIEQAGEAELRIERYNRGARQVVTVVRCLPSVPDLGMPPSEVGIVLLANGRGSMARLSVDLGAIESKYDCLLGANLHAELPVDRHVFAKRVRAWANADGFINPLNRQTLESFEPGPPARWRFVAPAGNGRSVEIELVADMIEGRNTTVLRFERPAERVTSGVDLPEECLVSLTVRVDIEDRNFHQETKHNGGSEHHLTSHCRALNDGIGFEFTPADDRRMNVVADAGAYYHEGEWCDDIPHPVEQTRGQEGAGDAYSPGWFDFPMNAGQSIHLTVDAEYSDRSATALTLEQVRDFDASRTAWMGAALKASDLDSNDRFGEALAKAVQAFVVKRDSGKTVIAGYPWFLDWGRDSLIAARGMLAAGMIQEVRELLIVFGRFEENGTLPNTIHGDNASNRDTSDAPLWYGIVCEDFSRVAGEDVYAIQVREDGRTILDVLTSIAENYSRGTPNGIAMDPDSGLIWSPSHFTWMDTNYPAATPREGYPIEIQVMWIRLLRQLQNIAASSKKAAKLSIDIEKTISLAETSFHEQFWREKDGWFSDLLIAGKGTPATGATADNALRSNCLMAIALDLVRGDKARRTVEAAKRYLVVPGGLRSLAPLPIDPPLGVHGNQGQLLNDPQHPYWGQYQGDEDTRRKPAYHNGTVWLWTFPSFCEALAKAWDFQPEATTAASAYLGSMSRHLTEGCLGQLPEILDGDHPHQQRGCDAQAWSATEALRVWKIVNRGRHEAVNQKSH